MPRRWTHGTRPLRYLLAMATCSGGGKTGSHLQIFNNGGGGSVVGAPSPSSSSTSSSTMSSSLSSSSPSLSASAVHFVVSACCGRSAAAAVDGKIALVVVGLRTLILVAVYFAFSIGLTFYQKRLIRDFPFPLSVVVCHVLIKFVLASVVRTALDWWSSSSSLSSCCRRRGRSCWCCNAASAVVSDTDPSALATVSSSSSTKPRTTAVKPVLGWSLYCRAVAITAISSAFDIGFSNWSFEYITVSLYTMTKSTSIVFILMFSVCLGLERLRASMAVIVVCISAGLVLFNYESTQFNLFGFCLVLAASFLSGVRWSYAQLIMQSKSSLGLENPVDMVYHVQPWMLVALLPFSATVEGRALATSVQAFAAPTTAAALETLGAVALGAVVAFAMELSEYLLVSKTSSLTLSVASVWKEVLTLFLDFRINKSRFSVLNIVGLVLCFLGIVVHLVIKARDVGERATEDQSRGWKKKQNGPTHRGTGDRRRHHRRKGGRRQHEALLMELLHDGTDTEGDGDANADTDTADDSDHVALLDRTKL